MSIENPSPAVSLIVYRRHTAAGPNKIEIETGAALFGVTALEIGAAQC